MRQGLIHLYTGDGKGKTTAALGLILRAHGRGLRIVLAQFLKGRETGELNSLEQLKNVTILRQKDDLGFYKFADEEKRKKIQTQNNTTLNQAYNLAFNNSCDLLVLDEVCAAYSSSTIDKKIVDKLILNKPPNLELVLTGRNAPSHFIEASNYVTELIKCKHPYDEGIPAREGVEF